jgi:hypothetical protein
MRNAILAAALAGLVAGCGSFDGTVPGNAARDTVGVAMHQPSEGEGVAVDPAIARTLDWKASQLCTLGYKRVALDAPAAEGDQQIVDQELRCNDYALSILGVRLGGVVPSFLPPAHADR